MARGNPAVPPGLRDVEQLELPVHHELAAVGDIEEDLADAVPGAGLGGRRRHGGALRGIERLGDLPDLIGAVVELPQRRLHVDGLAGAEAGDDLGQLAVGEFQGPRAQPPQPADQPVRQEQGGGERTDRQREHEHAEPGRPGQRLVGRGHGGTGALLVAVDPQLEDACRHRAFRRQPAGHGGSGLAVAGQRVLVSSGNSPRAPGHEVLVCRLIGRA
jgi:hypothetical protein